MKKIILLVLLFILPFVVFAQDAGATLDYADDLDELYVYNKTGEEIYPDYGLSLENGYRIKTLNTTAEIRLANSTIIRLSRNTTFTIDNLADDANPQYQFALEGSLRAIAKPLAMLAGNQPPYSFRTRSAVCGVRGTDLGLTSTASIENAICISGLIDFTNAAGLTLNLNAGQFADAMAETFAAVAASAQQMASFLQENAFQYLDEKSVEGHEPPPAAEEPAEEEEVIEKEPVTEEPEIAEEPSVEEPAEESAFMKALRKYLGFEIGTITIEDSVYSKAVIQPEFKIGKMSVGLYLPIVYETNLFDPGDWYKPKGNNEWSFGTDQTGFLNIAGDAVSDLALKFKYLEWGEQRDPFFFKVGNLDNLTVGHGILMNRYANDGDFPAIRRIGFNLGMDNGTFGMETVVNDLSDIYILGGRVFFRPAPDFFPMAIGISSIVDISPAGEVASNDSQPGSEIKYGNPLFITAAADIDFPIVETDFLSLILYADVGGLLPYFRETAGAVPAGFALEAIGFSGDTFKPANFGIASGLMGNILFVDYRLEYRYYDGIFRPAFFNPTYDRMRGTYAKEIYDYLNDIDNPIYDTKEMGIYGGASANILDMVTFEAGYMWPWQVGYSGAVDTSANDYLHLRAEVLPDVIPVVPIHGSIIYDRTNLVKSIKEGTFKFFDIYSTLKGEVVIGVASSLDIAILFSSTTKFTDSGEFELDADGNPIVLPSISIETRVSF